MTQRSERRVPSKFDFQITAGLVEQVGVLEAQLEQGRRGRDFADEAKAVARAIALDLENLSSIYVYRPDDKPGRNRYSRQRGKLLKLSRRTRRVVSYALRDPNPIAVKLVERIVALIDAVWSDSAVLDEVRSQLTSQDAWRLFGGTDGDS